MSKEKEYGVTNSAEKLTLGALLRHEIFNKLTPILLGCDHISDSQLRRVIQSCCLDTVTSLEDLISQYKLDSVQSETQIN